MKGARKEKFPHASGKRRKPRGPENFRSAGPLTFTEKKSQTKIPIRPDLSRLFFEIARIELIIFTLLFDELVVHSSLDNASLFHDHDAV